MKFNHYLAGINRDCPEVYRDQFLKYKLLKKLLKCGHSEEQEECARCEARFFDELRKELAVTNRHFAHNANKIIDSYHRSQQQILCFCFVSQRKKQRQQAELAKCAYWCRKYAKANAVALRKILKKHDKTCQNTAGRQFLQECWRSDLKSGVGLFLHSPLLDELKAIQDVLQSQMPPEDPDLVERAVVAQRPAGTSTKQQAQESYGQQRAQQEQQGGDRQVQLSVKTGTVPIPMGRSSEHSETPSSWGSPPGSADFTQSFTSPSLRQQRQQALSAIVESPTCMLDTGDIEWCIIPGGSGEIPSIRPQQPLGSNIATDEHDDSRKGASTSSGRGAGSALSAALAAVAAAAASPASKAVAMFQKGAEAPSEPHVVGIGLSRFKEEELKCPICLDVMYKPVGLGCGHKFCRQCALEAAGFGRAMGAFHNICSHIPLRAGCPQCRQTGVYRDAVALREVGHLIQKRYPEEWAERRAEEKARNKKLSAEISQRNREALLTRNPFELLFSE